MANRRRPYPVLASGPGPPKYPRRRHSRARPGAACQHVGVGHVVVSNLAYAHPGGDLLFSDVSFRVSDGEHVGLVGANGVGKTTLLKVLAGELVPDEGEAAVGGPAAYMSQDVGVAGESRTVRELLLSLAPAALRAAGQRVLTHDR